MNKKSNRKSGLKSGIGDIFDFENGIDLSEFITPYAEFQKDYMDIKNKKPARSLIKELPDKAEKIKAYIITFTSDPSLVYVSFAKNKDKAKSEATKYFRDSFYPAFMGSEWKKRYNEGRTKRKPEWDAFSKIGKVPVVELMKIGASFPCSSCGSDNFKYKDYEDKRCFIIEDEGNLNPFTKGFVLCYTCYKKYIDN